MNITAAMATDRDREYDRQVVGLAFAIINRAGWIVERDEASRCWDILTPAGWRACFNSSDLWDAIREGGAA